MRGDQALRTDQEIPPDYEVMRTVTCIKCATDFNIIHHVSSADTERADIQAEEFRNVLCSEHVDAKHHQHPESYDSIDDLVA
jgi:hypothetical protein